MKESTPMFNFDFSAPLVSVVTITYNSERFIKNAIDSILHSSYKNFELIIGDDCSTDGTWSIVAEYSDPRICKYRNSSNIGEYKNRNKAIQLAKGDYLVFIDGDDVLLYRGIENAVKEMKRFPECGFGIVKPENPKYIGPLEIGQRDVIGLEFLGPGVLESALCNNVYRTSFLKRNLFFDDYRNSDTYSRIYFAFFTPVLVLIDPIAIWRITPNQASQSIPVLTSYFERIHFYRFYLIPINLKYRLIDPEKLYQVYYRTLGRYLLMKLAKIETVADLRSYLMHGFVKAVKYCFARYHRIYWDQYDYLNINILIEK